jgi:hypothetical protein
VLWECGGPPQDGFAVANLTPLFVFQSSNVAKALRDFLVFRGRKKRSSSAALQNIREICLIRGCPETFLQKSIDILLHVQLKGAPSLALTCSAAGELTTGKNKKSGKNRKKC